MNKTLILSSFDGGIALHQRTERNRAEREDQTVQLATFSLGNLQGMMMLTAIETCVNIGMGCDIEVRLSIPHCERMVALYKIYRSDHAVHAMIKIALDKLTTGNDYVRVLEG